EPEGHLLAELRAVEAEQVAQRCRSAVVTRTVLEARDEDGLAQGTRSRGARLRLAPGAAFGISISTTRAMPLLTAAYPRRGRLRRNATAGGHAARPPHPRERRSAHARVARAPALDPPPRARRRPPGGPLVPHEVEAVHEPHRDVRRGVAHLLERAPRDVVDVVAVLVVARVIRLAVRAAVDGLLSRGLHVLGAGEQPAGRDADRDERQVVGTPVERGLPRREALALEVALVRPLDRRRPGRALQPERRAVPVVDEPRE